MDIAEKNLKRDIAYVKKGNVQRDINMFRSWVAGDSFKNIGQQRGCRPSLTATTCRRIAKRLVELNDWSGELAHGKYRGNFPEQDKERWLAAADAFESYLEALRAQLKNKLVKNDK